MDWSEQAEKTTLMCGVKQFIKAGYFKEKSLLKALTGLDKESAHPLQLHAVKRGCCTAANPGATGRLSLLKGITDLLHLVLQLYNSFTSRHEAATGGLIPYPIQ